jgi:hypothetical protein
MRKTKTITISQEGRDKGKKFLITEMSAFHADNWASRAIVAVLNAGNEIDIDPRMGIGGMLGMVQKVYSMLQGIKPEVAIPLWDELLQCIQVIPSNGEARELIINDDGGDIEEWRTYMALKKEAFMLHVDFFKGGAGLTSPSTENQ